MSSERTLGKFEIKREDGSVVFRGYLLLSSDLAELVREVSREINRLPPIYGKIKVTITADLHESQD